MTSKMLHLKTKITHIEQQFENEIGLKIQDSWSCPITNFRKKEHVCQPGEKEKLCLEITIFMTHLHT